MILGLDGITCKFALKVGEGPFKDIIYSSCSRFKFQPSKLEGEKKGVENGREFKMKKLH